MNLWREDQKLLPPDIAEVFEEEDITRAFDYMENVLHVSTLWRSDFARQYVERPRAINRQEFFIRFAMSYIDPHLLALTLRRESPTIAMLRFILRDKIEKAKVNRALNQSK